VERRNRPKPDGHYLQRSLAAVASAKISLFILGTLTNVYVDRYQRMVSLTELATRHQELRDKEHANDEGASWVNPANWMSDSPS
jgi:hypothetical protein